MYIQINCVIIFVCDGNMDSDCKSFMSHDSGHETEFSPDRRVVFACSAEIISQPIFTRWKCRCWRSKTHRYTQRYTHTCMHKLGHSLQDLRSLTTAAFARTPKATSKRKTCVTSIQIRTTSKRKTRVIDQQIRSQWVCDKLKDKSHITYRVGK